MIHGDCAIAGHTISLTVSGLWGGQRTRATRPEKKHINQKKHIFLL